MIHEGIVKGAPLVNFNGLRADIETTHTTTGMVAYATDTEELGYYNGEEWGWIKIGVNDLIDVNLIQFAVEPDAGVEEGGLQWNQEAKCLDLGMPGGAVQQLGREIIIRGKNETGDDIPKGTPVYIAGASGNWPTFDLADALTIGTISCIAITAEEIENNQFGFATAVGVLHDIDTSLWLAGARVYLAEGGGITDTRPQSPGIGVYLGTVLVQNADTGVLYCRILPIHQLKNLSDVYTGLPMEDWQVPSWDDTSETFALRTPSSDPGTAAAILRTDDTGLLVLEELQVGTLTFESLELWSDQSALPAIIIENENDDELAASLRFRKDSASPADDDELGRVGFYGNTSGETEERYGYIAGWSRDVTLGNTAGKLVLGVRMDAFERNFLALDGYKAEGEGEIWANAEQLDIDFRISAFSIPHALFVRGSDGRVAINTEDPGAAFHVSGSVPAIRIDDNTNPASYLELRDTSSVQAQLSKTVSVDEAILDIDPMPLDGLSDARVRLFRTTSTAGAAILEVYKGDGTANGGSVGILDDIRTFYDTANGRMDLILGDDAGSDMLRVVDSTGAPLMTIDSDGSLDVASNLLTADPASRRVGILGDALVYSSGADAALYVARVGAGANTGYMLVSTSLFRVGSDTGELALETGATEKVRIDISGNLGIGITTPTNLMHVYTETNGKGFYLSSTTGALAKLQLQGGDAGWLGLYTNNVLTINLNAAAGIGCYINNGGNFGINHTSPLSPLHVRGTQFSTAYNSHTGILIDSGGVTAGTGSFGVPLAFTQLGATNKKAAIVPVQDTSDPDQIGLAFFTSPSATVTDPVVEAMRLSYRGRLGVGATNPDTLIESRSIGSADLTIPLGITNPYSTNDLTAVGMGFRASAGGVGSNQQFKGAIAYLRGSLGYGVGDLLFLMNNTADNSNVTIVNERMRLTAAGYLGIGVTPVSLLHLQSAAPELRITQSTDITSYIVLADQSTTQLRLDKVTSTGTPLLDLNPIPSDGSSESHVRLFRDVNTSGTVRFRIYRGNNTTSVQHEFQGYGDSFLAQLTGKVGVGLTSAATLLGTVDVAQESGVFSLVVGADVSARTRTNNSRKFARIGLPHYTNAELPVILVVGDSNGTDNYVSIGGGTSAGNAATGIRFYVSSTGITTVTGTERVRIISTGYVGINTTDPALRLHVVGTDGWPAISGTVQTGRLRLSTASAVGCLDFGGLAGAQWIQATATDNLSQVSSVTLNPYGGNIGINTGTVAPATNLSVQGDGTFVSSASGQVRIQGKTNTNLRLNFGVDTTSSYGWIHAINAGYTNLPLILQPPGGAVGIGVSPEAQLEIFGGTYQLRGSDNKTNATTKYFRVGANHYLNVEEPMAMLFAQSTATTSYLNIGGGTSFMNAVTSLRFWISPSTTSTTGTEQMRLTAGILYVGPSATWSNAYQTYGLLLEQLGADDEILNMRSTTDVGAVRSGVEAGTFGKFQKTEGNSGGLRVVGLKDSDGVNYGALHLAGYLALPPYTTKTSTSRAIVEIYGVQTDGNAQLDTVAGGNVLGVYTYTGGLVLTASMLVDQSGLLWIRGILDATTAGIRTKQSVYNVSNPPTKAQLDAAFGTPATLGRGFMATVDDNDGDVDFWLVGTSDASWYYLKMTKAI